MTELHNKISLEKFDQFESNTPQTNGEDKAWLLSYLDLMTLLLVLFVALISKATLDPFSQQKEKFNSTYSEEDMHEGIIEPVRLNKEDLILKLEKIVSTNKHLKMKRLKKNFLITIPDTLLFKAGEANMQPQGRKFLLKMAKTLKQINGSLQIEGHADSDPIRSIKFPSNWELSAARAATVARTLESMGIAKEKLSATGYGDVKPLESNATESGKRKNRRVVINVKIDSL